jgi:ABC-type Fe3+/spermidine/putrescine transport system ATPase subunit
MNTLLLQHVKAGYGNRVIVKDVSLEVRPKEAMVIMGPSGCGKTTLFLSILGIITPRHGRMLLNDQDIAALPIEQRNIGYLPQAKNYGLFPHLNVLDNVAYGLRVRGVDPREREKRAREVLELVELHGFAKRRVDELSGGQSQRIGLARALAIEPQLLLLDEPLSNVDQVTKFEVASELKKLFERIDIPVLLVTHGHEDAVFLGGQLAVMVEGKIEQVGTVKKVMQSPKTDLIKRLLRPFGDPQEQRVTKE